jgi:flagellar protein FliL
MARGEKAVANTDAAEQKPGPSLVVQLGALALVTAAAVGLGWVSGGYLNDGAVEKPAVHAAPTSIHGETAEGDDGHASEQTPSDTLIPLAGITTNLAAPDDVWVRMEVSIVLDEPQDASLPELVHQDLLAFVRTVKMHQIEGASGFQHFKADLEERAAIRSDGHVKQVLIRTLLFE